MAATGRGAATGLRAGDAPPVASPAPAMPSPAAAVAEAVPVGAARDAKVAELKACLLDALRRPLDAATAVTAATALTTATAVTAVTSASRLRLYKRAGARAALLTRARPR